MKIHNPLPPLPYERAPRGAEDKWWLTRDTTFRWRSPPRWAVKMFAAAPRFERPEGFLRGGHDPDGVPVLSLTVRRGFHFAVSAAPDFGRALAAACLHDWIYKYARELAAYYSQPRRRVLRLADHWFLAQMRASGFLLKRSYFCAVRVFGHAFNSLFSGRA